MIPDNIIKELNQAFLDFTSHSDVLMKNIGKATSNIKPEISGIITKRIPKILSNVFDINKYEISGSIGKGRQTRCPWVAVMDKEITDTTQKGVYIVFLMTANLKEVYITIGQGTTVDGTFGRRLKGKDILTRKEQIRSMLNLKNEYLQENDDVDVADKHYKESLIYSCPWDLSTIENKSEILEEYVKAYQKYKELSSKVGTTDPSDDDDPYQKLIDKFKEIHAQNPFNGFDELYKWKLITLCQGKSNIEIAQIIYKNHVNLLYNLDASSLNRTVLASEDSKSRFGIILGQLFDESADLGERLVQFRKSVKENWPEEKNLPNGNRSASVFLACKYPQKYTFCIKHRVFLPLCKYLGETEDPGPNFYPKFMELIQPLVEKISADQELKDMIEESTKGNLQSDPLTAQTIIYTTLFHDTSNVEEAEDDSDPNDMETPKFEPTQKIFFGTPGGGKSFRVKKFIEEERNAKGRYFRVTFHPDTDYASFVGSYKPIMKGNEITYEYVPQVFTRAYIAAWNDPKNEYFIDIEEINRGNCAQIFGDLFQLLDRKSDTGLSEYPVKADADLCNYLVNAVDEDGNPILKNKDGIKNNELRLPANLSIVATMNTSDQSLFPMDSAFKRRWDWEYVPSTFKEEDNYNITIGNKTYKWHKFLKEVNDKIKDVTDSEDKQMGAYFIKRNVDEEAFKSKVMYYLWSEICKEEYKTQNNFFRYKVKDNDQIIEKEFTFNELYPDGAKLLVGFMKYLKVKPVEQTEEDNEEESEDE